MIKAPGKRIYITPAQGNSQPRPMAKAMDASLMDSDALASRLGLNRDPAADMALANHLRHWGRPPSHTNFPTELPGFLNENPSHTEVAVDERGGTTKSKIGQNPSDGMLLIEDDGDDSATSGAFFTTPTGATVMHSSFSDRLRMLEAWGDRFIAVGTSHPLDGVDMHKLGARDSTVVDEDHFHFRRLVSGEFALEAMSDTGVIVRRSAGNYWVKPGSVMHVATRAITTTEDPFVLQDGDEITFLNGSRFEFRVPQELPSEETEIYEVSPPISFIMPDSLEGSAVPEMSWGLSQALSDLNHGETFEFGSSNQPAGMRFNDAASLGDPHVGIRYQNGDYCINIFNGYPIRIYSEGILFEIMEGEIRNLTLGTVIKIPASKLKYLALNEGEVVIFPDGTHFRFESPLRVGEIVKKASGTFKNTYCKVTRVDYERGEVDLERTRLHMHNNTQLGHVIRLGYEPIEMSAELRGSLKKLAENSIWRVILGCRPKNTYNMPFHFTRPSVKGDHAKITIDKDNYILAALKDGNDIVIERESERYQLGFGETWQLEDDDIVYLGEALGFVFEKPTIFDDDGLNQYLHSSSRGLVESQSGLDRPRLLPVHDLRLFVRLGPNGAASERVIPAKMQEGTSAELFIAHSKEKNHVTYEVVEDSSGVQYIRATCCKTKRVVDFELKEVLSIRERGKSLDDVFFGDVSRIDIKDKSINESGPHGEKQHVLVDLEDPKLQSFLNYNFLDLKEALRAGTMKRSDALAAAQRIFQDKVRYDHPRVFADMIKNGKMTRAQAIETLGELGYQPDQMSGIDKPHENRLYSLAEFLDIGVCNEMAMLFQIVMQYLGIRSMMLKGQYTDADGDGDGGRHAWVLIMDMPLMDEIGETFPLVIDVVNFSDPIMKRHAEYMRYRRDHVRRFLKDAAETQFMEIKGAP
jgi:hypothetical protein